MGALMLKDLATNSFLETRKRPDVDYDWGKISSDAVKYRLSKVIELPRSIREGYFLTREERAILRAAHRRSVKIIHKA